MDREPYADQPIRVLRQARLVLPDRTVEGDLLLLAKKWQVAVARVEPFDFAVAQGRDVERNLVVQIER